MKLLDVVILLEEYAGLAVGTKGAVVLLHPAQEGLPDSVEVEFFDVDGKTILEDMTTAVPVSKLKKIWSCPTCGKHDCTNWKGPRE